jgi:ureidoacrylate peracid hydrolase
MTQTKLAYNWEITALLVIDPYNDFISEGGKIWDRIKAVAEANHCVVNMLQVLNAARQAKLRVFYAMHRRYRLDINLPNYANAIVTTTEIIDAISQL